MSTRTAAAIAAVLTLALSGCGLPDDREPRVITAAEAPIDLDPSSADVPTPGGSDEVTVFYLSPNEGQLKSVDRSAEDQTVQSAIEALLAGPTADEVADLLQTKIPQETILLEPIRVDEEVATINLGCDPELGPPPPTCGIVGVQGTDQHIAFGQFVCTATEVMGVASVVFQQDGQPLSAQIDAGTAEDATEPLRCSDYRSLGPDRS